MTRITATDFKANLGKYLSLVWREDIQITKNGTDIAVLTAPKTNCWADELTGVIPCSDVNAKEYKTERLAKKHDSLD